MSSENSDSDASSDLADFQLTNNIKREKQSPKKSPSKRKSSSLNGTSSEELNNSNSHNTTNISNSLPLNLQHYIAKYGFVPEVVPSNNALDALDSDDEVFLIQAPKDFDLKEFVQHKLNTKKTNKLETREGITLEYYVENFTKKPNLNLICGTNEKSKALKLTSFKPQGKIIIREKIHTDSGSEKVPDTLNNVKPQKKIPFPKDIQVRHPLLGAFYKDKINLPEKVVKQLSQTPRKLKKIKKEIKVEMSQSVEEYTEVKTSIIESLEKSPKKHKKSKKLKRENSFDFESPVAAIVENNASDDFVDYVMTSPPKKKVKLEKFDDENDLSWLSQI